MAGKVQTNHRGVDKPTYDARTAVGLISNGATVMIGGFGGAGSPVELLHALIESRAHDLTIVSNNAGNGDVGLAALIREGRVRKIICSFPRSAKPHAFQDLYEKGGIQLEVVPQGTLAEKIRAGGAGIPAFYTRTGVGTQIAEGKEHRVFAGATYILEEALVADFALVKARAADEAGNLVYNKTARNFGPIMCMAGRFAIVQVERILPAGAIDPEIVVTPGVFVDALVEIPDAVHEETLVRQGSYFP